MEKRRRPRALTLTLPDDRQPYLVFDGRKFALRNLSAEGIGLWVPPPAPFGMRKGSRLNADIVINDRVYTVGLEVARESERMFGLKILHKSRELAQIFNKLLEPSFYAADLVRHPKSEKEDPDGAGPRLWYTGKPGVELVVWYHEFKRMILATQLVWGANWVFRSQFHPTQTGLVGDREARGEHLVSQMEANHIWAGRKIPPEELMVLHSEADSEVVSQAAQFLTCVPPPLPGTLLWQFLETGEQVFLPENVFEILKVA